MLPDTLVKVKIRKIEKLGKKEFVITKEIATSNYNKKLHVMIFIPHELVKYLPPHTLVEVKINIIKRPNEKVVKYLG